MLSRSKDAILLCGFILFFALFAYNVWILAAVGKGGVYILFDALAALLAALNISYVRACIIKFVSKRHVAATKELRINLLDRFLFSVGILLLVLGAISTVAVNEANEVFRLLNGKSDMFLVCGVTLMFLPAALWIIRFLVGLRK